MMWPEYSLKINIHYVQKISFYNYFTTNQTGSVLPQKKEF